MPGANALGCECPPAPAFGLPLLLFFAAKGTGPERPVTCGLAFNWVRRESKNEGRHMDGPEGWHRIDAPHARAGYPDATPSADGPGHGARDRGKSPRMPAAMASLDAAGMHSGQGEVLARAVRASMMKDRKSTRLNSSH